MSAKLVSELNKLIVAAVSCKSNGLDRAENWHEVAGFSPRYFEFAEDSLFDKLIRGLAEMPLLKSAEEKYPPEDAPIKYVVLASGTGSYYRCRSLEQASEVSTCEQREGNDTEVYEVKEVVKFKGRERY